MTDQSVELESPPASEMSSDWYYHGLRLKNYRSPMVQVTLVGLVAFSTV